MAAPGVGPIFLLKRTQPGHEMMKELQSGPWGHRCHTAEICMGLDDSGHFQLKYAKTQLFSYYSARTPRSNRRSSSFTWTQDVLTLHPVRPLMQWIAEHFRKGVMGNGGHDCEHKCAHLVARGERFHGGFFIFSQTPESALPQRAWAREFRTNHFCRDQAALGSALHQFTSAWRSRPSRLQYEETIMPRSDCGKSPVVAIRSRAPHVHHPRMAERSRVRRWSCVPRNYYVCTLQLFWC